ncbi:MAG TPA: hypothetical protein VJO72_04955, partial [Candidatus Dormibacteraeota bacterium]|nr:hypothetical protein [Candidatus Dormibacteraeota bacterium]
MGNPPPRRRRRGSRRHFPAGAAPRPASGGQRTGPRWLPRILLLTGAGLLAMLIGTGTLLYTYAGEMPSLDH